jgi:methionyl-tRNA synthetase
MEKRFYITTTLPYVNADPHIGFAREIVQADVLARFYQDEIGKENVFFNTGTDEHGLKVFRKAQELGITPQEYCDQKVESYKKMKKTLNLEWDNFVRTTDNDHKKSAQEFWKKCEANGDIYKKNYKIKYCVGCELEKTESELVDGCCPLHPDQELEIIDEENYFFRFSKYQKQLLELYEKNPDFVTPKSRFNEVKKFVERGLEDFSISRLKRKMPWGVEVPGDPEQVMYVWFDALVNFISSIGWPSDMKKFNEWWPVVQLAGKDNLRQQAAMWQAMLMSAGIKPSKQIFINGFINISGQKMSKSLGNVISPQELVEKFGTDGARYLLLTCGGLFGEDADVTWEYFEKKYNADLANGLGNLVSRVVKLLPKADLESWADRGDREDLENQRGFFKRMELNQALEEIWEIVRANDKFIEEKKPWELAKKKGDEGNRGNIGDLGKFEEVMKKLVSDLNLIADLIAPFLPTASKKIKKALEEKKAESLFPRIGK